MTHDELIAKAVEQLKKSEQAFERHADKVSADVRRLKVDQMLKRTVRDAVVISFEGNDAPGRIEIVMDSHTGQIIESKFIPAKGKTDGEAR